jgi:hypothetical protein
MSRAAAYEVCSAASKPEPVAPTGAVGVGRIIAFAAALACVSPTAAVAGHRDRAPLREQAPARARELARGTTVRVRIESRLKSGAARRGDRVDFTVAEDVVDPDGRVLIRKGAAAEGTVEKSRGAGFIGRQGRLAFSIDFTTAVDGQRVALAATEARSGKDHKAGSIAAAVVFAPAALFITGKNVTIEPGTEFVAAVAETARVGSRRRVDDDDESHQVAVPQRTVVLLNGDQITGQVTRLKDGTCRVTTTYGTQAIPASEVARVRSAGR